MSGLAVMLALDGRPADGALVERMANAIAHRGPDGIRHLVDGPAALGHCMLATTPESVHELQPLWDESRRYCLVMDGRVDNREELASALAPAGLRLRDDTDAEIALKAYIAFGEDCPGRIIGDFALVIYDARERRLFCARDAIGVKPFYYWTDGRTFLCASELQQLFQHPDVKKVPNEGMVAEYLSAQITSLEETLYAGIMRLAPAHVMIVTDRGVVRRRYWDADPTREADCQGEEACADRLLEIIKESVRCRLRSNRPVGAELSGGLDSSSVVGAAQLLLREGSATAPGFEAWSLVFPGLPCDESQFIDAVADLGGLKVNKFVPENGKWCEETASLHQDFPDHPNSRMSAPIYADMQRKGVRAYLTGFGGDEWLDRWYEAGWRQRLRGLLEPYPRVLRAVRGALGNGNHPRWIPADFARRVNLAERLTAPRSVLRFRSRAQRTQHSLLTDGHNVHALEMTDRLAARFGIEPRHPLDDRRLVEFMLPLRDALHRQGDTGKVLLRRTMSGALPAAVRDRRSKAEFSVVFSSTVAQGAAIFQALETARRGWLDAHAARRLLESCSERPWPAWFILGTETWYRAVSSSQRTL